MTIKDLKAIIETLPDDCVVKFLYDGPDTCTEIKVDGFWTADDDSEIVLNSGEW